MINEINKKLIVKFNKLLIDKLNCEIFKIEYKYNKKELHLVKIKDTGLINPKTKNRIFREVGREAVLEHNPNDETMYVFLFGLLTMVHIIDVHIVEAVREKLGNKAPETKQ